MASSITYQLPQTSSSKLSHLELTGAGGYSAVYRAQHEDWGIVAVKKFIEGQRVHERVRMSLLTEAENLARVKHRNIVSLLGTIMDDEMCALVLHYQHNGNLYDFMQDVKIHWPLKFRITHEIILGMNYLHTINPIVIHRDLKSHNILIDDNFHVQITDFGISDMKNYSKRFSLEKGDGHYRKGTLPFIPPESWADMHLKPNTMFDVYSFAILLWEILTEKLPFQDNIEELIIHGVLSGQRPDLNEIPLDAPNILCEMMKASWRQDPDERPTFGKLKRQIENEITENNYEAKAKMEERQLSEKRDPNVLSEGSSETTPESDIRPASKPLKREIPMEDTETDRKLKAAKTKRKADDKKREILMEDTEADGKLKTEKTNRMPDDTENLYYAIQGGNLDLVKLCLRNEEEDLYKKHGVYGSNILHYAAEGGHFAIVKYLIEEKGMDPRDTQVYGSNILHYAAEGGHLDIVKYLIEEKGMDPSDKQDVNGLNSLHFAASGGCLNVLKYLIEEKRMDSNVMDEHGRNVLQIALFNGQQEVAEYLI